MRADDRSHERGFTIIEVMVTIVLTSIAVFGISGAVLGAMHAQATSDLRGALDDDALAVVSDVRMMTAYDATMMARLSQKNATMTRKLPSGDDETISLAIVTVAGTPAQVYATATASSGTANATERIELYTHAPAPGSVVNQ